MTAQPKISVCIPTHNRARYLGQSIDSVFSQTLQDFEIIVYDDASSDDTNEVLARVLDPRLRCFRQSHNVGIARNRNSCLTVARGEYIAWLDSDDLYQPEMLELQSAVLDRHPEVGLVHGAYHVIDSVGRQLPDWPRPFTHDIIEAGKEAFRELVVSNYVIAPTVMVRRNCYTRVGPYAAECSSVEDWEMWMRIALHYDLAYNTAVVAQYRQHEASVSTLTVRSGERLRREVRAVRGIFARHHALIPQPAALRSQALAALAAKALIQSGDAFTLNRRAAALASALLGLRIVPALLRSRHSWLFLLSLVRGHEYGNYRHSKALLGMLHVQLAGTRYGDKIRKLAFVSPEWEETLQSIARTVNRIVPRRARVAIVDKWDPTILHLSQRGGWHFPDRQLLPEGYPRDSDLAIQHLEQLRQHGAGYLVFPNSAFWWLDYYQDFRCHLDTHYHSVWCDEQCIIYQLSSPESRSVDVNDQALNQLNP